MPRRPAEPANSLSCSRAVRVSILLKSSFIWWTCSSVWPVYLRTSAIDSSMLAKAWAAARNVTVRAVKLPKICVKAPQFWLSPFHNLDMRLEVTFDSPLIAAISVFTFFSCLCKLFHSSELRSTTPERSCFCKVFSATESSLYEAEDKLLSVSLTCFCRVLSALMEAVSWFIFLLNPTMSSPLARASLFSFLTRFKLSCSWPKACFACLSSSKTRPVNVCVLFAINWS